MRCRLTSSARGSAAHTATRRRAYQNGTLRAKWKCHPHGTARSGPSGSAAHTATRRRTHGLHALTLPLDVERTKTVRSGPSGSADHAGLHAQARVAVRVRVAYEPAVAAPMPGRASRTCLERVGFEPCSRRTLCGQWNVFLQGRSGWPCSWPARCSQPPSGWHDDPSLHDTHASAGHCPCHNACRPSRRASRAGTSPPAPHPRAHSARTPRSPRGPRCSLCAPCPRVHPHRCAPR